MATTIKLKNSVTATNAPSSLVQGEVAINVTDKKVWVGNAATTPIQLLGGGADGSFTNISVSSVATFGAGTVSAPALTTTGDTNTGIFFPTADTIAFTEGGVEAMRIDSSGNVGIGTTAPITASGTPSLTIGGGGAQSPNLTLYSATNQGQISFAKGLTGSDPYDGYLLYSSSTRYMGFGTAATERMRIDSSGNLLVRTTTIRNSGIISVDYAGNSAGGMGINDTDSANASAYIAFLSGGTFRGSITNNNNSAVAYNTTSDYRLKENIAPMIGALAKVAQLKPCTYTWKETGNVSQGFIAHELAEVCPDSVTGEKDAVDELGNPKYQGVDTSFLVATLTAAIQELKAELDSVKAELQTLKGN